MFGKLAQFVVYNPWKVIAAWVIAAVAVVMFAPTLNDVLNREQSGFLPDTYESVQAQHLAKESFAKSDDATGTIVLKRNDGAPLSQADQDKIAALATTLNSAGIDRVVSVTTGPQALSPNKEVQLVNIAFKGLPDDPKVFDAIKEIREVGVNALNGSGIRMAVTGDAALGVDNEDAFANALAIVGFATIALIVFLLLVIYRSPVAALLPILSVGIVSSIAPGIIALVAKSTDFRSISRCRSS